MTGRRWSILALVLAVQTVANIGPLGIPAIASLIRDDLGLTLPQAGSFLSAVAFGYVVQAYGSYNPPLFGMAAMLLVSALLFLKIDPTRPLVEESSARLPTAS